MGTKKKSRAADRAFDPKAGEGAFNSLETTLRAMPAESISAPYADVQSAALAALALVDVANASARKALLAQLPEPLFAKDAIEQLETAAWATWFAHTRLLSETAASSGTRVDTAIYDASGKLLAKMLKLIDYHVGDMPGVAAEIGDIRSGTGYQDRAADLVRTAALWEHWQSELEQDGRNFDVEDGKLARKYAEQILQSLRAAFKGNAAQWADLRNRAWTRMVTMYDELKAAGQFAFRNQPDECELFVSLRQAVSPVRPRRKAPQPAPTTDATAQ